MDGSEIGRSVLEKFKQDVDGDKRITAIRERTGKRKGDYSDASEFASLTGRHAGSAIAEGLTDTSADGKVSEELAGAVLRPVLHYDYELVTDLSEQVQGELNRSAGLGLKPVVPGMNEDRVEGLIKEIAGKEDFPGFAKAFIQQTENFSMSIVDDFVKSNAEFHYQSGMAPKIHRIADSKCCEWCDALAGTYEYSKVNNTGNDVFRRHANCRCRVLFDPAENGRRIRDAHSKRDASVKELEELEKRKKYGLQGRQKTPQERNLESAFARQVTERQSDMLVDAVIDNHEALKYYEPEEIIRLLEKCGYQVKDLAQGSLRGIPFEEGGGFRIHFGGDGYFQYHPDQGSHHGGAYWKIGNGKRGVRRYRVDGEEKRS